MVSGIFSVQLYAQVISGELLGQVVYDLSY